MIRYFLKRKQKDLIMRYLLSLTFDKLPAFCNKNTYTLQ